MDNKPIIAKVLTERRQTHETRRDLLEKIEKKLERKVVTFFTSFFYPVMIEDADADMLEGVLQKTDTSNGIALIISSPGGLGLSAERIINICRNYSGTGEFQAVVPSKAKSAATMICFGASKIIMGKTSELGPIDPQIRTTIDEESKMFSVCNIVDSYEKLFSRAVRSKGNLQPFLQQLSNYDEREITEYKTAIDLGEDIAIQSLQAGMMKGKSKQYIRNKIKIFLKTTVKKAHGRPIYYNEASQCDLTIDSLKPTDILYKLLYELYIRTNDFVSKDNVAKCVETIQHSFAATTGQ